MKFWIGQLLQATAAEEIYMHAGKNKSNTVLEANQCTKLCKALVHLFWKNRSLKIICSPLLISLYFIMFLFSAATKWYFREGKVMVTCCCAYTYFKKYTCFSKFRGGICPVAQLVAACGPAFVILLFFCQQKLNLEQFAFCSYRERLQLVRNMMAWVVTLSGAKAKLKQTGRNKSKNAERHG